MNLEQWTEVDRYFVDRLDSTDPILDEVVARCRHAQLPSIQVTPNLGRLLQLLARCQGAKSILEIGTLGGYSTIWLARALPADGRLVTLEVDPTHADVAVKNFAAAGLDHLIELHLGPALEMLPRIAADGRRPFDMTFIDADKCNCPGYFDWALRLSRPGSLIVVDNVVRGGEIANEATDDEDVRGIRILADRLRTETRVSATAIQTVGSKGYDGFLVAVVDE